VLQKLLQDERILELEFPQTASKLLLEFYRNHEDDVDVAIDMAYNVCSLAVIPPSVLFPSPKHDAIRLAVESKLKLHRAKSAY